MKEGTKAIHFELPEELHRQFKAVAVDNGQTLKGLLIQMIRKEVKAHGAINTRKD